ncbi:hypothetical protein BKE38_11050 [Pseudoroseomonas deserti]|uniref:Methyltransferase domain-containing protein n=1 Tax=Teichococcus deserti TaxID=1817963 RepID=A0A1V2H4Q6_9PROT|nr:class I SAM-dependent methyltransferase [Pseudoroseomonas deserti]ONG54005.1 hypothetical protein BKE38_11050 [Pseudoroseomonas deserti]
MLRLRTFRWLLQTVWPDAKNLHFLDVGAGPGHFSRVAARHGFAVTALDARPAWALAEALDQPDAGGLATPRWAPRAEFRRLQADIRDIRNFDEHDVIGCIGLLYHLPLDDQARLLRRAAGRPVIVDTELYDAARILPGRADRFEACRSEGRYGGALVAEKQNVYSAVGPHRSFWFDEASILAFFRDQGRTRVTQVDPGYSSAFGSRRWYLLHG